MHEDTAQGRASLTEAGCGAAAEVLPSFLDDTASAAGIRHTNKTRGYDKQTLALALDK